jgi:aldehyde:ferredoxin oxidoreductase
MHGWAGKILRVDLSNHKVKKESFSEYLRFNYLGGRGVNSRILYEEVKPGINPLGMENRLIFGVSPLTGTGLVNSGRCHVTAKSPLTGILGDSNSGGHFGPELKWAGYDHIVFEGRAERPVYLWVDDENVELRDAHHLWGKIIPETYQMIWKELGDPRIRIAAIGPAGENLVRFACIINDYGNAFGKTGMGAVMGSKNLKAIAVRGTRGVSVAYPERFRTLAYDLMKRIQQGFYYPVFSKYGTVTYLSFYDRIGRSLAKNGQQVGGIDYIQRYTAEKMNRYFSKNMSCFGCPVHCKHQFEVKKGQFSGLKGHGVEFCIMSSHGPSCGQSDPEVVFKLNQICNEYGVCGDTSGITVAAAFEWYQRGLIGKEDTDGIALEWGNAEAQIQMLYKIIRREGLGDILADGSVIAAKKIGKGAEKFNSHVKGADLDQVDIRTLKGCALSDVVSSRGADPQRGWSSHEVVNKPLLPEKAKEMFGTDKGLDPNSYEEKGEAVSFYSSICTMSDTLGICKFNTKWTGSAIGLKEMADLVFAATSLQIDEQGLFRAAARINNVERVYLVKEGITRRDDTIHGRMMDEPVPSGPFKGERLDKDKFSRMLDEYYEVVGWDRKTGIPTRATLDSLGLKDVADDLEKWLSLSKNNY